MCSKCLFYRVTMRQVVHKSDATSPSLPHWWVLHIQGRCECDYSDYPHYAPAAQRHCHQEAKLHNTMPNTSICKLGVSGHRTQLEMGGPAVKHWNMFADVNNDPDGDNYPFTMSSSLLVLTSCKNINLIWCGSYYLFWNIANILKWSLGHFQPKVDQPVHTETAGNWNK